MPGRHRDAVLRDQEARDGTHAAGAGALPVHVHAHLLHQQLGAQLVLRGDRQVRRHSRLEFSYFLNQTV